MTSIGIRPPLLSRVPRAVWLSADLLIALVFAFLYSNLIMYTADGSPRWYAVAAALATTLPIAVRRLWPRAALVTVLIGTLGMRSVTWPSAEVLCTPLALYAVAAWSSRRSSAAALVASLVVSAGLWLQPLTRESITLLGWGVASLIGAWSAGVAARTRRAYTRRLAEHAAEVTRAELLEERLRIARELHDVLGHSLSTIAVQAGVAAHVGAHAEMGRALSSIEQTSRSALRETRRLLGIMRADGEAELVPAHGLEDLPALVERSAAAGPDVELVLDGTVPEVLGLTVYRIVQEALTNVFKHSDAGHVRVTVRAGERDVLVEVVDDGRAPAAFAFGHGLTGLRERAHLFGGCFEAGPRPPRGFRVAARLPLCSEPGETAGPGGADELPMDAGEGQR